MADTFATLHIDSLDSYLDSSLDSVLDSYLYSSLDSYLDSVLDSVLRIEMSFEYRNTRSVAKWIAITGTL